MSEYIKVMQEVYIPKTCDNCLYCGSDRIHCGNANNHGRPMAFVNYGRACEHFWLDQHRYPNAESRR